MWSHDLISQVRSYHNLDVTVVIVSLSHALVFVTVLGLILSFKRWLNNTSACQSLKAKAFPKRDKGSVLTLLPKSYICFIHFECGFPSYMFFFLPVPVKQAMKPTGESPQSRRDTKRYGLHRVAEKLSGLRAENLTSCGIGNWGTCSLNMHTECRQNSQRSNSDQKIKYILYRSCSTTAINF